ncbi:RelA/SpoT family protein [Mycoplasmoides pneumoniae]|uniref:RelA/SpoT family protein n=1 Tax=Mycoplasmoides pneumoniae TaxID=2104 RepID=UPI000A29EDD5|nr:RelA/SpoT family protein [Mycoplasmoides pneumoniae]ARQ35267.1 guanosine-3',5'-bis(diphosphate) 3'-pyrophosphohydrolase [Mycoplasmoides pneumoniae]
MFYNWLKLYKFSKMATLVEIERDFLQKTTQKFAPEVVALITKALDYSKKWHGEQKRLSGEPFFIHPLRTALRLVEWNMDSNTVCAGLLHDIIEDTQVTEADLTAIFGKEITDLVVKVTKITSESKKQRQLNRKKEDLNLKSLVNIAMSSQQEVNALVLKLADRLDNISSIEFLAVEKQKIIAKETLELYAKIAGRIGMYPVKTQLADLSFKVLDPKNFNNTLSKINQQKVFYDNEWGNFKKQLEEMLEQNQIEYRLESRIKGIYSTYQKLTFHEQNIAKIHDLFAIRLIVKSELDCYHLLGLIHLNFTVLMKHFKDYIASPKQNFYQSIHTTVRLKGLNVEIQIRTQRMDHVSKYGFASHWIYKEKKEGLLASALQVNYLNSKQMHSRDFFKRIFGTDIIKVNVSSDNEPNIVKKLNVESNSKLLDIAYELYPKQFNKLEKIKLDGVEVMSFDVTAENEMVIEFCFGKTNNLKRRWLRYMNNPVFRERVKKDLNKLKKAVKYSELPLYEKALEELHLKLADETQIKQRLNALGIKKLTEFLELIEYPHFPKNEHLYFLASNNQKWRELIKPIKFALSQAVFQNSYFEQIEGIYITKIVIETCCTKIPDMPEQVIGILMKNILRVHLHDCRELANQKQPKIIPLYWNAHQLKMRPRKFRCQINIRGVWSETTVNKIVQTIIEGDSYLERIIPKIDKQKDEFELNITMFIDNYHQLITIMEQITTKNISYVWKYL